MKLTIITINYNNRDGLRRTMESVINQSCQDFEYVVIDGGSTDGSREVIIEHQKRLTYWCSEPDRGIYHAMNKGVPHATGEYCLFLNSGDYLYNKDVIKEVLPELNGKYDIVYGELRYEDENGNLIPPKKRNSRNDFPINSLYLINSFMPHQACFIKEVVLKKEPYDENYKIISDKKFFIACYFIHNCSFHHIDKYISVFNTAGLSRTNIELSKKEGEEMLAEVFPKRLVNDISSLDSELIYLWSQIPTSFRLRRLLLRMTKLVIKLYGFFKNNHKSPKTLI